METIRFNYLGPSGTPQDIKNLRQSNWDYQRVYGMPVIHKHRWTEKDVREGKAQYCPVDHPLDEDTFTRGREWDPYCFGTGYLGGFDDGVMVWVTLADIQEDVIRFTPEGNIERQRTPGMIAPWLPDMDDGDLIITADFTDNNEVITERDRYELREVTPQTIRGFQRQVQTIEFKVGQQATIEKLPYNHPFYQVPVVFDITNLPPIGVIPGANPWSSTSIGFSLTGINSFNVDSAEIGFTLSTQGTISIAEVGFWMNAHGAIHSYV